MTTQIQDNPAERRFEILQDGVRAGLADYTITGDRMTLTHTETSPEFGGRGLARRLIGFALDEARARGLSVVPVCPYALRVITEHQDEYLDLVPADERGRFSLPEAS